MTDIRSDEPPAPDSAPKKDYLHIAGRRIALPRGRAGRTALGSGLIVGGVFGFLPILGFWMIPLGVVILSRDSRVARRIYRVCRVRIGRWWQSSS